MLNDAVGGFNFGAATHRRLSAHMEGMMVDQDAVVVWEFKDGSAKGRGKPILRPFAEAWVQTLNAEYPHIRHWIEDVTPVTP